MTRSEIRIPKSRRDTIYLAVLLAIVVFFVILSVINFLNRVAIVASSIWLLLVTSIIWAQCREEKGIRNFLVNLLATFAGKPFAESSPGDVCPAEIRFGFDLFGRRFYQHKIAVEKIESVEWSSGQATDMAKRDMKDWHVCLWFDHDDPTQRREDSRKPNQDIYIVGPARRREDTEAFALAFVDFLRDAGASLVRGEGDRSFVRTGSQNRMNGESPNQCMQREQEGGLDGEQGCTKS